MARILELPPPPENPVRSPAASVRGEETVRILGTCELDGRVCVPNSADLAVLICHPHPLYGGSMHSPVPLALAKTFAEDTRIAWLRFSFRGVPESSGQYDDGRGETDDARAALDELRKRVPNAKLIVCGHSFGSWVGLKAAVAERDVEKVVLIAPSTRFFQFGSASEIRSEGSLLGPSSKSRERVKISLVIGDQDDFCDVSEAEQLAKSLGATFHLMPGFEHDFLRSRRAMAEKVLSILRGGES